MSMSLTDTQSLLVYEPSTSTPDPCHSPLSTWLPFGIGGRERQGEGGRGSEREGPSTSTPDPCHTRLPLFFSSLSRLELCDTQSR